ncbi:MAG: hypothetical protein OHK0013_33130 [Sandaracinaceae bacterium]
MLLAIGCGGPPRDAISHALPTRARAGEVSVLAIPRPLGDMVALSLWIDAGTLDGPHASTAVVAAEVATARARERRADLEVLVTPDGTWFRTLCARGGLADCIDTWSRVLGTRRVEPIEVERAARDLAERRTRAAVSAEREAEALAVGAALGLALQPLGDAEDPVETQAIEAFLEANYGVDRALVIAVGDVTTEALAELVSRALNAPRAHRPRATRVVTEGPRVKHEESSDDRPTWSVALRVPGEADAAAVLEAWRRRVRWWPGLTLAAFPTREGWVTLATFRGDASRAAAAARWLGAWRLGRSVTPSWGSEGAWDLAERAGLVWVSDPAHEVTLRVGVGVVGAVSQDDLARVERALDARADGSMVLRELEGAAGMAVVWRLEGPATEPAAMLGSTALAARLLRDRCAPEAGLVLEPEQAMLTLRGEAATVAEAVSRWRDCLLLDEPSTEDVDRARRAAMVRVGPDDARRVAAAELAFGAAPSLVAPEAARDGLGRLEANDVVARWRAWARAEFQLVAVGAPAQIAALRNHVALSSVDVLPLRASGPEVPNGPSPPTRTIEGLAGRELLVVARLEGCGANEIAQEALAALLARGRLLGGASGWRGAGCATESGLGWAALTMRGVAEDALVEGMLEPPRSSLEEALRRGEERAARRRAVERSDPLASALELARGARASGPARLGPVRTQWLDPAFTQRR